jgi:hypothetical protein
VTDIGEGVTGLEACSDLAVGGGFALASAMTASAISIACVGPPLIAFFDLRLFISSRRPANFECNVGVFPALASETQAGLIT